jgi:hypothetical protein
MARKTAKIPVGAAPPPRRQEVSRQVVSNVGLYFAAYKLSKMDWNVMPTSRNARGVDILAYDMRAQKYLGIQVKALSKRNPVPLGRSIDRDSFMGDWWIIVIKIATDNPECFIMKPDEVRRLAIRTKKAAVPWYYLPPTCYATAKFREAWDRIGPGLPNHLAAKTRKKISGAP